MLENTRNRFKNEVCFGTATRSLFRVAEHLENFCANARNIRKWIPAVPKQQTILKTNASNRELQRVTLWYVYYVLLPQRLGLRIARGERQFYNVNSGNMNQTCGFAMSTNASAFLTLAGLGCLISITDRYALNRKITESFFTLNHKQKKKNRPGSSPV